jgi:nicotinamide-nucleotide amidase
MNAELISVGTEILLGQIVNTNAAWLAQRLATFGVNVYRQVTVGDNLNRLAATITDSLSRADLLILTGGLGPTDDDLTREGVALATNRPLETDEAQKQWLIQRFQSRFGKMPENNLKQALKPKGSLILPNPNGTACGYAVPHLDKWIFLLPGPPWEMEAMFENEVVPLLSKYFDLSQHLFHRTLKFFGIGESALEMEVIDLMRSQVDPTMALYAGMGEVQMRLTTRAESKEEADIKLELLHRKVAERVGIHIYGQDDESIFSAAASQLLKNNKTLALAESCTGGLLASSFTDLPGSSGFFTQGWVTYSNQSKIKLLNVPQETLESFGAVSEETVTAMATQASQIAESDYALAISGIAGPGGGTEEKPVGLVWIALYGPNGCQTKKMNFNGSRGQIKMRAAKNAAYLLWQQLNQ